MDPAADSNVSQENREVSDGDQAEQPLDVQTSVNIPEAELGESIVNTWCMTNDFFEIPSQAYYNIFKATAEGCLRRGLAALHARNCRLPPELLTKIFELAMPDLVFPRRSSLSPLGLSHVCAAWRNAALGSSGLWNRLSLDVRRHSRSNALPELITCWFLRATIMHPLAFSLINHIPYPSITEDIIHSIIPFLHRLSELHLEKVYLQSLAMMFCLAGGRLPMLEELFLDGDGQFDDIPRVTVFGIAPRLRVVKLGITSPTLADGSRFIFPWAQLTTLKICRPISLDTWSKIMFQCLRLCVARFMISYSFNDVYPFVPSGIVEFASLLKLKIQFRDFSSPVGLPAILSKLHLPNLRKLSIESLQHPVPYGWIHPGSRESLSSVRTLCLFEQYTMELELLQFVSACSSLEDLILINQAGHHLSLLRSLRLGINGIQSRPSFSYLKCFTFMTVGWDGVDLVLEEFVQLILSWVKDTLRNCDLRVVTLMVCDRGGDPRITWKVQRAFNDASRELRPWIRAEDGSGYTRGFIWNARVEYGRTVNHQK